MIAPSAMMDGSVAAIRNALDAEGFKDIPIMSYAAKYASAFYGPFREVAAYSVSGEYAMIKTAAAAGLIDEHKTMCESAVAVFRAGANMLITYFAKELAVAIERGDI